MWIRLPFRWKRLQREGGQPFDVEEVARLRDTVAHAIAQGGYVVLDPHDYARRDGIIGSGEPGAATQADAFARSARRQAGDTTQAGADGVCERRAWRSSRRLP